MGAIRDDFDRRLRGPHPLHSVQEARAAETTADCDKPAAALWASDQTARGAAPGGGEEASDLR